MGKYDKIFKKVLEEPGDTDTKAAQCARIQSTFARLFAKKLSYLLVSGASETDIRNLYKTYGVEYEE